MKKRFEMAISQVQIIPLEGDRGVVVEVDITPNWNITREILFTVQLPDTDGRFKPPGAYYRDGARSGRNPSREDILLWTSQRYSIERDMNLQEPADKNVKLCEFFCRGEVYINDTENKYFLFSDVHDPHTLEDLEWVKLIDWEMIFDFDPLPNLLMNVQSMFFKPPETFTPDKLAHEIQTLSSDSIIQKIRSNPTWVRCCADNEDYREWSTNKMEKIVRILTFFTQSQNVASKNKVRQF